MKCNRCGYENDAASEYCASCGEKLNSDYQQPQYNSQYNNNGQYYNGEQYSNNGQYNQNQNTWSGKATAGLTCGIISLFCAGLILGILAIVFSLQGKRELREKGAPTGTATAGLILGIIGLVGWAILIIYEATIGFTMFNNFGF